MSAPARRFVVGDLEAGRRLDVWLAEASGVSRAEAQRWLETGAVTMEGRPASKGSRLQGGETVEVAPAAVPAPAAPAAGFSVVYEDEDLAVVAKPAGVVVHPAPGLPSGTLVEALASRMPLAPAGGPGRPGIVHRLDKDTSGLMVIAKTDAAHRGLVAAMGRREVGRTYLALAGGTFALPTGRIEAPMGRSARDRTRMGVVAGGREAVTEFTVLEGLSAASLLEIHLRTGRTHQIRVHLSHIHHPVVGDATYGRATLPFARSLGLERPFLHAARLTLVHPITGAPVDIEEALPEDLERALGAARRLAQ